MNEHQQSVDSEIPKSTYNRQWVSRQHDLEFKYVNIKGRVRSSENVFSPFLCSEEGEHCFGTIPQGACGCVALLCSLWEFTHTQSSLYALGVLLIQPESCFSLLASLSVYCNCFI